MKSHIPAFTFILGVLLTMLFISFKSDATRMEMYKDCVARENLQGEIIPVCE